MNFRSIFTEPNEPAHPAFRYGMLVVCLCLLAWHIHWQTGLSPTYPYDRYGNGVVALMLLLNHVAYQFRWPTPVSVAFRIAATGWLAFALFYIFYLSGRLYP